MFTCPIFNINWLFQTPPPLAQWASIFITFLTFIGLLITAIQILCSRPKIIIEPKLKQSDNGTLLSYWISNYPIHNCILLALGVHKKGIEDLLIFYNIEDTEHKPFASAQHISEIKWGKEIHNTLVAIPASSHRRISFDILVINQDKTEYCNQKCGRQLIPGEYYIKLTIFYSGKVKIHIDKFIISEKSPYISWTDSLR